MIIKKYQATCFSISRFFELMTYKVTIEQGMNDTKSSIAFHYISRYE